MNKIELITKKTESLYALVEKDNTSDALRCLSGAISFIILNRVQEKDIKRAIKTVQLNIYDLTMDLLHHIQEYENNKKRSN